MCIFRGLLCRTSMVVEFEAYGPRSPFVDSFCFSARSAANGEIRSLINLVCKLCSTNDAAADDLCLVLESDITYATQMCELHSLLAGCISGSAGSSRLSRFERKGHGNLRDRRRIPQKEKGLSFSITQESPMNVRVRCVPGGHEVFLEQAYWCDRCGHYLCYTHAHTSMLVDTIRCPKRHELILGRLPVAVPIRARSRIRE